MTYLDSQVEFHSTPRASRKPATNAGNSLWSQPKRNLDAQDTSRVLRKATGLGFVVLQNQAVRLNLKAWFSGPLRLIRFFSACRHHFAVNNMQEKAKRKYKNYSVYGCLHDLEKSIFRTWKVLVNVPV